MLTWGLSRKLPTNKATKDARPQRRALHTFDAPIKDTNAKTAKTATPTVGDETTVASGAAPEYIACRTVLTAWAIGL